MSISDRLDQIEARRAQANSSLNGRNMLVGKDVPEMLAALRAVLDLHNPEAYEGPGRICEGCDYGTMNPPEWPCPTYRAIAAALGEES